MRLTPSLRSRQGLRTTKKYKKIIHLINKVLPPSNPKRRLTPRHGNACKLPGPQLPILLEVTSAAEGILTKAEQIDVPIIATILAVFSVYLTSCVSSTPTVTYGVQPEHTSFVPARIALLKCRMWPNGARYDSLPLSNLDKKTLDALCLKFDEFVLKGFQGQPYMRGLSAKAVEQVATKLKGENFIASLDQLWSHTSTKCNDCLNGPSFYTQSIAERPEWRFWLSELSRATKSADAILVPFVMYANHRKINDRGMLISELSAGIDLFLVDTNNGYLLWAGGRSAVANNKILIKGPDTKDPAPPTWDTLYDRLFIEEVWREFPGRQVYH